MTADTMNALGLSVRLVLSVVLAAAIVALALYASSAWLARAVRAR